MDFENKKNMIRKFINAKKTSEYIKVLEITKSIFCLMIGEYPVFFIVKDDVITYETQCFFYEETKQFIDEVLEFLSIIS